jgi:hypothetical protein
MVWLRVNGSGHQVVQTRVLKADGSLTAVQGVSPSDRNANNPAVDVAPTGDATYAWASAFPIHCRRALAARRPAR